MSWKITPSNLLVDDADALAYLTAVEAADTAAGQSGGLESGVRLAVNAFVKGCKADGIWPAIKASCILAGARTLNGALVPLVGAAPTNFNFVSGDYNRKTGLVGDGSTKYLNSNRNNNSDPQNNRHAAVSATALASTSVDRAYSGCADSSGTTQLLTSAATPSRLSSRCASTSSVVSVGNLHVSTGIFGVSRSVASSYVIRGSATNETITSTSDGLGNFPMLVFARHTGLTINGPQLWTDARLAFYSIGESLDLAALDTRVTALINAFGTAIA